MKRALEPGYAVTRADQDDNPGAITPRIITAILEADLIVVDMSGGNPNVFYETAIAHGYSKPVVHLQAKGERAAFDLKDMSTIRYDIADLDDVETARETLVRFADYAVQNPDKVETPLKTAQRFVAVERSENPVAESNAQVAKRLERIESALDRLVRQSSASPRPIPSIAETRSIRDLVEQRNQIVAQVVEAEHEHQVARSEAEASPDDGNALVNVERHAANVAVLHDQVDFMNRLIAEETVAVRRSGALARPFGGSIELGGQ